MSVVTDRRIPDSPVDQRLPLTQLLLVGFQHVLLMYGGAVAVPLIVGQAAGLSREEIAFLINATCWSPASPPWSSRWASARWASACR